MEEENKPKIRVFSTKLCPYCNTLKAFLKMHNVEFDDIDVSIDEAAFHEMVEKSGQLGVPVVEIDNQIVVGFNKPKISQLLKLDG